MVRDSSFTAGDEAIRDALVELAAKNEIVVSGIDRDEPHPGVFVYSLRGSSKSVAFREREIRLAAEPSTCARFVTPRLHAVFEETWWYQALVLMGFRKTPVERAP